MKEAESAVSNEECAEIEVNEYSPYQSQQSSPAPSFQLSKSGSAELSEEVVDEYPQIQRKQSFGPLVSPSNTPLILFITYAATIVIASHWVGLM
jgi:hypothetical protein